MSWRSSSRTLYTADPPCPNTHKSQVYPKRCYYDIHKSATCLPRLTSDGSLIKVKLKRKLSYKGHYLYQQISPNKVKNALVYLKEHNPHYASVDIHDDYNTLERAFLQPSSNVTPPNVSSKEVAEDSDTSNGANFQIENVGSRVEDSMNEHCLHDLDSCTDHDPQVSTPLFTCLQPTDIAQYLADNLDDSVLCLAPAESNKPVSIFNIESAAFPTLFSDGKNTFLDNRITKMTHKRYFNARLFSADTRYASNPEYIFYAQYASELEEVCSSISIAMRKGSTCTADGKAITSSMLKDTLELKKMMQNDEGYRFLKKIRGTTPYWESTMSDVFAMVRQLGIPTWFCSFSTADRRWKEIDEAILEQQGKTVPENITWTEHCNIIGMNPVTAARMFDHRVKAFITHVILSPAKPVGEVINYFYRVEFQQRGWPHIHCLFWVKDAPVLGQSENSEVVSFINQYISCELPSPETDPELHEIITNVQTHSKTHSKSCKKGGKVCRFNFPKLPSTQTFMSKPESTCTNDQALKKGKAEQVFHELWDNVFKILPTSVSEASTFESILQEMNISQTQLQDCCNVMSSKETVYLKRNVKDIWINNYNKHLLRLWNADMDIQFVLDAYSFIMYILSYITKAEHEMGALLKQAQAEARQGNTDPVTELKSLGSIYLNHREISILEAVYRITGLQLKHCSRRVVFVPTDKQSCRISLPLSQLRKQQEDTTNIWQPSIIDKYLARPTNEPFSSLFLATFVSQYHITTSVNKCTSKQHVPSSTDVQLKNNLGYLTKRMNKDAVVRFTRVKKHKDQEKYYQNLLCLYLLFHTSEIKPQHFTTYEEFYLKGIVNVIPVSKIVAMNMKLFEPLHENLEEILQQMKENPIQENAWADFASQSEIAREEESILLYEQLEADHHDGLIPEIDMSNPKKPFENDQQDVYVNENHTIEKVSVGSNSMNMYQEDIRPLLQTLNVKQKQLFNHVHNHCKQIAQGYSPKPFHVFLTGGAGTGKSQLIKCVTNECRKVLSPTCENPESITVLLVAYTGTAAYNVGGQTIHSAFNIYNTSMPYKALREEQLNSLRAKLQNLKLLIIDEISMVDQNMMHYIHGRLQQITKANHSTYFGNVSFLAVGDFYQLPPVKGKPLYKQDAGSLIDLWNVFKIFEFDEIMRQKDDLAFAQMLNRFRIHDKGKPLQPHDHALLLKRMIEPPTKDILYIAARRKIVDHHNACMLSNLCTQTVTIRAVDMMRRESAHLEQLPNPLASAKTVLRCELTLSVGARVMLTVNVDVSDGLANGVVGTSARSKSAKTISSLKQGPTKPYQTPLRCVLATRSQTITCERDGSTNDMIYIALCDGSDSIKTTLYNPEKVAAIPYGSTIYIKQYILRSDKTLVLTGQSKIYHTRPMTVSEAIIQQAVQLVRPPTPPPIPIQDIKKSPVKTLTSLSGEIAQITTPPGEELHLTLLAISTEPGPLYSLLCQIGGHKMSECTCKETILREMIPMDMEVDEHQRLEESLFEHLPAICCVLTNQKAIIAVKQRLHKIKLSSGERLL
ncbi:ATP-dependent DNA helicase PIF1 [Holothuria leucospilota]|uniref:ATP-dependent DNA helicase n=1 Tax=Holothuria leucospilota TaxID=206669 RepID=A0A9Q0YD64_HOLLE|nr:ATP-dependent DNA helicase PIF1 [Holothuria leucospilota]